VVEQLRIRLGVKLYRGQFEPLLPPPEVPDPVFEEEAVEPVTGELPAEPPAEEVVAFGFEVVLTGGA
jgi:hypothetical protein